MTELRIEIDDPNDHTSYHTIIGTPINHGTAGTVLDNGHGPICVPAPFISHLEENDK